MRLGLLLLTVLALGCSSPANEFTRCPTTDGAAGEMACLPATFFASRASTTLLIDEAEFHRYYDLFLKVVTAEPLLNRTNVVLPYTLYGPMRTRNELIGTAWAKGSFRTAVPAFNDLVTTLGITPYVETYEILIEETIQYHTIYPELLTATRMYSNKLVGEAFAAVGVLLLGGGESGLFPGDSTWMWTGDGQARIDIAAGVGNCFDGNGCGTHYFQVDVTMTSATVRDKGGFVPANGLNLAPGTIPLPN